MMDEARASGVVGALAAASAGTCGDALTHSRRIKNEVVGNLHAKRAYVSAGAIPALIGVIRHNSCTEEKAVAEALAALSSLLVRNEDATKTLVEAPYALEALLEALHSSSKRVTFASARCIKVLVTSRNVPMVALEKVATSQRALPQLVALAKDAGPVCAAAAAVLAAVVRLPEHGVAAREAGILAALLPALRPRVHPVRALASVHALAALVKADAVAAYEVAKTNAPRDVLPLVRAARDPALRLAACRLLARLRGANVLQNRRDLADIADAVIPQLVALLADDRADIRIATPPVLAEMVADDFALQQRTADEGAILKLALFFPHDPSKPPRDALAPESPRGIEVDPLSKWLPMARAAMQALAALCLDFDDAREQVVDARLWPHIVRYLADDDAKAALAAARCLRSLTRSVKILRRDVTTTQLDLLGDLLVRRIKDDDVEMRQCISAVLCNIVIDFCPLQRAFIDRDGIAILGSLLRSEDVMLRKNALWAIKNLLFKADVDIKSRVMNDFSFESLIELSVEPSAEIRELAMNVVRNLACFGSAVDAETKHIDMLFMCMGGRLLEVLERALQPDIPIGEDTEEAAVAIAVQALYTVCNIASGAEQHKVRLIESEIPRLILQWISHRNENARIAAVWCTINLSRKDRPITRSRASSPLPPQVPRMSVPRTRRSFPSTRLARRRSARINMILQQHPPVPRSEAARAALDDEAPVQSSITLTRDPDDMVLDSDGDTVQVRPAGNDMEAGEMKCEGYEWRIEKLRELGFEGKLRQLVHDPHVEVQGRARAALEQFSASDINALDYSPRSLLTRVNPQPAAPFHQFSRSSPMMRTARIAAVAANASDDSSAGSISDGSNITAAVDDAINNSVPG